MTTLLTILALGAIAGLYGYICHLHDRNDALAARVLRLRKRVLAAEQERDLYQRLYALAKKRTLTRYMTPHPRHEERAGWRLN